MYNNTQKYFPFGIEKNFVSDESELQKEINERNLVSARVVEYDIENKVFTLSITDKIKAVLYNNELFDKANTAKCYIGRIVSVLVSNEKNEEGYYICNIDPRSKESEKILYLPGTKLQATVVTHLGYGALLDIGLGKSALLHINKIKELYPEIKNPSEVAVLAIGQTLEVYVDKSDDNGTMLSLNNKDDLEAKNKILSFLKNKIALKRAC